MNRLRGILFAFFFFEMVSACLCATAAQAQSSPPDFVFKCAYTFQAEAGLRSTLPVGVEARYCYFQIMLVRFEGKNVIFRDFDISGVARPNGILFSGTVVELFARIAAAYPNVNVNEFHSVVTAIPLFGLGYGHSRGICYRKLTRFHAADREPPFKETPMIYLDNSVFVCTYS